MLFEYLFKDIQSFPILQDIPIAVRLHPDLGYSGISIANRVAFLKLRKTIIIGTSAK